MLKFRILCALLTFGVGSLSTIPFSNHLARRGAVWQDQRVSYAARLASPFAPTVESGLGGDRATVSGNDEEFVITTGDTRSYSGVVVFHDPFATLPKCSAWIESSQHHADISYKLDLEHSLNAVPIFSGVIIKTNGSYFPANTRIFVSCPGVQ